MFSKHLIFSHLSYHLYPIYRILFLVRILFVVYCDHQELFEVYCDHQVVIFSLLWLCAYPFCVEVIVIWLSVLSLLCEVIVVWLCTHPSCVEVIVVLP